MTIDETAIELLRFANGMFYRKYRDITIRYKSGKWIIFLPNYENNLSCGYGEGKTIQEALEATIEERKRHKAWLAPKAKKYDENSK
jgi:hypothetical protein